MSTEHKQQIFIDFPWLRERDLNMVVGNDLDALMSALVMHHFFNWQIIGFYNLESVYLVDGYTPKDLFSAVWLDLDIYRSTVKSVGHHILTNTVPLIGHKQSFNPNLQRGIGYPNFSYKYPFSTVLLLLWLLDIPTPAFNDADLLLGIPDSVWINMQNYAPNAREWAANWINSALINKMLQEADTDKYEARMEKFLQFFERNITLNKGNPQSYSKRRKLTGHQCKFKDVIRDKTKIHQTFEFLESLTSWHSPMFGDVKLYRTGEFYKVDEDEATTKIRDLEKFTSDEASLFSYAIVSKKRLQYTLFHQRS